MRKLHKFLGIIALGALIMVFGSCSDDDNGGGGGGVPAALVGKWHLVTGGTTAATASFEMTADNHLTMQGQTLDVKVEGGKTIIVSNSGTETGRFDYTLNGTKVTLSNSSTGYNSFNGQEYEIRK